MDYYKRVNRELVYKGTVMNVYADTIEFEDGSLHKWDYIQNPGGAGTIAVKPDGRILMVRQYRNGVGQETLEIPAGARMKGESHESCALRELEEEAGYQAGYCEKLAEICSNVALMSDRILVYLCTNLTKTAQHLDEGEFLNVESYTLEELMKKVRSGEIMDAKTVTGILAYYSKLHS